MANRDCEGDFFLADGVRYYRCMWDSTVLVAPEPGSQCPNCKRDIAGQDHGRLETHTRRFVVLPETGWEADLPPNDQSHRDAQGSLRGSGGLTGSATGGE